jgi:hypothetical protein
MITAAEAGAAVTADSANAMAIVVRFILLSFADCGGNDGMDTPSTMNIPRRSIRFRIGRSHVGSVP